MTLDRPNMTLAALHLAGNAVLLLLGYYWLGIGESRTLTLLWSLFVALFLVAVTAVLHGATFAYFREPAPGLPAAFRTAVRHLPAIVAGTLAVLALYVLLDRWAEYSAQPAFTIASWFTLKLRKPVKPATILRIFSVVTWLVRWTVLPMVLLPMVASAASRGWRGFTHFGKLGGRRVYWLACPLLLLCAFWLPFRLIAWVPTVGSFAMEIISFTVRFLIAYLLFVGAWLLLAFLTSAGRPVLSQSRTVVSP